MRILEVGGVVRPLPAPISGPGSPRGAAGQRRQGAAPHFGLEGPEKQKGREGKWWERGRGRSQAACMACCLPRQLGAGWPRPQTGTQKLASSTPQAGLPPPPRPPGGLAWSQAPSAQKDDWDGTPTQPWAPFIPGVARRKDSAVKSEATGGPPPCPSPAAAARTHTTLGRPLCLSKQASPSSPFLRVADVSPGCTGALAPNVGVWGWARGGPGGPGHPRPVQGHLAQHCRSLSASSLAGSPQGVSGTD